MDVKFKFKHWSLVALAASVLFLPQAGFAADELNSGDTA